MIINEIEKTILNIVDENETDNNCMFCRWYYMANDEEITRCHYCGYSGNMPCLTGDMEV